MSENGKIHGAICSIMAEIGGVEKSRKNQGQGYQYRGIADLYLATQPLMAKHRVHIAPYRIIDDSWAERPTKNGGTMACVRMRVQYRVFHEDGSFVEMETTGEAMDSGDKATNKAMSSAMKYALIQLFAIPEEDPEIDTEHASPALAEAPNQAPSPVAATAGQHLPKASKEAVKALAIAMNEAGIKDREEVLAWCSIKVNRDVTSRNDLTVAECSLCIDAAKEIAAKKEE